MPFGREGSGEGTDGGRVGGYRLLSCSPGSYISASLSQFGHWFTTPLNFSAIQRLDMTWPDTPVTTSKPVSQDEAYRMVICLLKCRFLSSTSDLLNQNKGRAEAKNVHF